MNDSPPMRCSPDCRCMPNDKDLFAATEKAYDMVFKGIVDFSSIKAGLELGLFEALADGPRDLASLAETTGSVPPRLEKLLITMSQIGLARQHEGLWSLTNFSEQFFTRPEHHRNMTMVPFVDYLAEQMQSFYLSLADVVRGKVDFTALVPHPPRTTQDSLFYETIHRSNIHFLLKLLRDEARLDGVRHLIDVGGGVGDIAASLCATHPELHVSLINLPSAVELIEENLVAKGVRERVTPTVIDMYREPYPKGDAVLFSRILYPMNPPCCTMLCQKAFDALEPGGKILILDMDISNPQKPNYDYLSHYLCGVGMGFSVLEFKDHHIYPELLRSLGFVDVTSNEAYEHVLYQAVKP